MYWQLLQWVQGDFDTAEEIETLEHVGDSIAQPVPAAEGVMGQLRTLDAAAFEIGGRGRPVTVVALEISRVGHYWFWTTRDASYILANMLNEGHIRSDRVFTRLGDGLAAYGPLYMMMWGPFEHATAIPDSEEYKRASVHISIDEIIPEAPSDALTTLQSFPYLARQPIRHCLSDDRYREQLDDWEIYIAERVGLCAAEYLEIKRRYMDRYQQSVVRYRKAHNLEPNEHLPVVKDWKNKVDLLTAIRNWDWARRRTFVQSFDQLGMLDENRFK